MKKQGWILVAITGAFLCLLLGVFLGRYTNKTYIKIQDTQAIETTTTDNQQSDTQAKININTATVDQLQVLHGIGKALAQRIVDYREENGNFETIEDLMNVKGIGQSTFASIQEFITIS